MLLVRLLFVCSLLVLTGCSTGPDWYAPPVQREPLVSTQPSFVGPYIRMADPNADAYILHDVSPTLEGGSWRWSYRRPELQFFLAQTNNLKFSMDFAIAGATFQDTGPITLTVEINGQLLDRFHYDKPGPQHLEKPVPPAMVKAQAINKVVFAPDKVWVSKTDGTSMGVILTAIGFLE